MAHIDRPTVMITLTWMTTTKRWVLRSAQWGTGHGELDAVEFYVDTTAEIDRTAMVMCSRAVQAVLEQLLM